MRAFDVVIYGALIFIILWLAFQEDARTAPPPPPPQAADELGPLPPRSFRDPEVQVFVPADVQDSSGTAFAIGPNTWMTARHVVDGCRGVFLSTGGQRAVRATNVQPTQGADLAILTAPLQRDAYVLELAASERARGELGYHLGFPQGRPGEAASQLMGRATMRIMGRFEGQAPILAWAERSRTVGLVGALGGMSGGPTFDGDGDVVGVTIAESPRRGRIYTAAPASLAAALNQAGVAPDATASRAEGIAPTNYGAVAARERKALRIAKVYCAAR